MNANAPPPAAGTPPKPQPSKPGPGSQTRAGSLLPEITGRDREFLPAALEILETPPAKAPVAMVVTICVFFAAALAWSFLGHLDVDAVAQGKIETHGHAKVIQPLDPGKVAEIRTENGEHVKMGDLLVTFDETEANADVKAAQADYLASSVEVVRRRKAIEIARAIAAKADIGNSQDLIAPIVEIDWDASIPEAPESLRHREEAVLAADLGQLSDTLINIAKQMAQKDATKQRLNMSIAYQEDLLKTLNSRVDVRQESIKRQVGTKINLFDAQEELQKSQSGLASDRGQLIETDAALEELKSERIKALSQFIADNQSKLADAAAKADDTQQQYNKAEAKLKRTRLYSPIDGIVQQQSVTTIGQVVTTGQQLMVITPETGELTVQALVNNQDIGFIKVGQDVAIKVDAFPFTRFGTLHGKVTRIATDAIDEEDAKRAQANAIALANGASTAAAPQGQSESFVFPVSISLNETAMKIDNATVPLVPGMTVTAEIKTDSRRVIDYLFSPIAKISSEAMKER